MLVKRLWVLATVVAISTTSLALAGDPQYSSPVPNYTGFYLEGSVGLTYRPWRSDVTTVIGAADIANQLNESHRANGGFVFGFDGGYQFSECFSLEGGWFYLPTVSSTINGAAVDIDSSGILYAVLKASLPIYRGLYLFGKFGPAYTYNKSNMAIASSDGSSTDNHSNYWNPLFGLGFQYYFTPVWSLSAQYAYIGGYRSASANRFVAPVTHLFTVAAGYKFVM